MPPILTCAGKATGLCPQDMGRVPEGPCAAAEALATQGRAWTEDGPPQRLGGEAGTCLVLTMLTVCHWCGRTAGSGAWPAQRRPLLQPPGVLGALEVLWDTRWDRGAIEGMGTE